MNILTLDLELNKQEDDDVPNSKTTDIIQIGAAVLDTATGEIKASFSRLVKPTTPLKNGELRLSKFITKLTRITDEQIESLGTDIITAYNEFIAFAKLHDTSRIAATWGGGDLHELREQINLAADCDQGEYTGQDIDRTLYNLMTYKNASVDDKVYYMRKRPDWRFSKYETTGFCDVKKLYQLYNVANNQKSAGGLKKAMNKFGLTLPHNMSYHNAEADAIATAKVLYKLMQALKINKE